MNGKQVLIGLLVVVIVEGGKILQRIIQNGWRYLSFQCQRSIDQDS